MNKMLLFISVLLVLSANAFDADKLAKYSTEYDKNANPHKDLATAMQKAKLSGKNILLLIGGDWCRWSGTFDNFLEDNEKVAESFYNSFEVLRVYYGKGINKESKSLLKQFPPLKATPHFYVLDKNAKLLKSIDSSPLERGYGYHKSRVVELIENNK